MTEGDPPLPKSVVKAIEDGRSIEAIKRLREKTGLGLREAKEAVDAYNLAHPDSIHRAPPREDRGIARLAWVCAALAIGYAAYAVLSG